MVSLATEQPNAIWAHALDNFNSRVVHASPSNERGTTQANGLTAHEVEMHCAVARGDEMGEHYEDDAQY